jgi:hypothetical protein
MATKNFIPDLQEDVKLTAYIAPKARFAAEFATIVTGMSMTVFAERAVVEAAGKVEHKGRTYEHFWERADGSPSVALVLMYTEKTLTLDTPLQAVSDLIHAHIPFFYERDGRHLHPKRRAIEVLWPHVYSGRLSQMWTETKNLDPWRVGEAMSNLLKKANVKPPAWGPGHE